MVLVTTGTITKALRDEGLLVDRDQVCYAVRKLRLEPVGFAGPARVFPPNTTEVVRNFLDGRRNRKQPQTNAAQ